MIGIMVGHSLRAGQGAYNEELGVSEFKYNSLLADRIVKELNTPVNLYKRESQSLLDVIRGVNADQNEVVVELHCNAYNKQVSGTEVLVRYESVETAKLALKLSNAIAGVLKIHSRGVKRIMPHERGGKMLYGVKAKRSVMLIESFFIDNVDDLILGVGSINEVAKVIADTLSGG